MTTKQALNKAIEHCGGIAKLGRLIGSNNSGMIYMMLSGKKQFGPIMALRIEHATNGKVRRYELLPDYDWSYLPQTIHDFKTEADINMFKELNLNVLKLKGAIEDDEAQ